MLGTFIKELRARRRHGLREFCLEHGHDPIHWSKIEREVLPPPHDEETLRTWAKQLGLKPNTDDWLKFFDYAAVDAGRIPDYVMKDEELNCLGNCRFSFARSLVRDPRGRIWRSCDYQKRQRTIQSTQAAGYSDWLAADEAALDCIATRIAPKFGVSAEVIAKRMPVENLWPPE